MSRHIVRVVCWTLPVLAACGDGTTGPDPEPQPEPVVVETARFTIVDNAGTPRATLDALGARLEADFDAVGALLPDFLPPPVPITVFIQPGEGIPFVNTAQNTVNQWRETLAPEYFPHQLTHLYTGYQRTNFIEEGIAVYVTEELMRDGERPNPFRGQVPHAWVSLYEQHNSTISLFTALRASNLSHSFSGSSPDASAWQVFVEAGSFTRWMIDTHGVDQWFEFYLTANLGGVLGQDTPEIERAWLAEARALYPDPLVCEDALGDVGTREEFWCARARGE